MKKKKIRENFFEILFFDFPKIFSVEIFHMMSTLCMQNYSIIGQGVPEIQGVTDRQTQDEDLLYRCLKSEIRAIKSRIACNVHSPLPFLTQK